MNARPIKINQSPYREFRLDPLNVPFSQIYMDYMGPFSVKDQQKQNIKTMDFVHHMYMVSCHKFETLHGFNH